MRLCSLNLTFLCYMSQSAADGKLKLVFILGSDVLLPLLCLCCISTVCYFYSCVIIQLHIWHRWMLGKGEVEAEHKEEKEMREKSQPLSSVGSGWVVWVVCVVADRHGVSTHVTSCRTRVCYCDTLCVTLVTAASLTELTHCCINDAATTEMRLKM